MRPDAPGEPRLTGYRGPSLSAVGIGDRTRQRGGEQGEPHVTGGLRGRNRVLLAGDARTSDRRVARETPRLAARRRRAGVHRTSKALRYIAGTDTRPPIGRHTDLERSRSAVAGPARGLRPSTRQTPATTSAAGASGTGAATGRSGGTR